MEKHYAWQIHETLLRRSNKLKLGLYALTNLFMCSFVLSTIIALSLYIVVLYFQHTSY